MRHRRSPRSAPAFRFTSLLPAIVLLVVTSGVDVAWGCVLGRVVDPKEATQHWRKRLEAELAILDSGTIEERLDAAERVPALFVRAADEAPDPSDPGDDEVALALGNVIALQPDEYVSWTVIDSLLTGFEPGGIRPLLREALGASSPNVRAHAVRWFEEHEDGEATPLLEDLWSAGLPEWARGDLMGALARQGSKRYLEEFLQLAAGDDPALAPAAIDALDTLGDERLVPILVELTHAGTPAVREAAMDMLSNWRESDEAFRTILAISRGSGEERAEAVWLLGLFMRPEGDERLLEVLTAPEPASLRLDAARALENSDLPGVTERIVDLLDDDREWFISDVLVLLHNRNDPAALPRLEAMTPPAGPSARKEFEDLIGYLGRQDQDDSTFLASTSCGSGSPDPDDPHTWHIEASRGTHTVRCDRGPGIAGASWFDRRIPDGALVTFEDRFDRDGVTWGLVAWDDDCWVPMTALGRGKPEAADPPGRLDPELDLPAGALASKRARHLIDTGVIEVLDTEGDVAGVAFHLELGGPTLVTLLEGLRADARRAVEDQLDDVLDVADDILDEREEEPAPDDSAEED